MNPESENFEALRRLMSLKRHEQPPPGYFNRLPGTILARIECGDGQLSIWEKMYAVFAVRPTVAYALGVAACGAVAFNVAYWARTQSTAMTSPAGIAWQARSASPYAEMDVSEPLHVANWLKNTNPAAAPQDLPSLFAPVGRPTIQAAYYPGN